MSGRKTNNGELSKTLKYVIKTDKRIEAILEKITARHTYAIQRILEIIEQEGEVLRPDKNGAEGRLDALTITTSNRPEVKYDLKKELGLNTCDLQQCGRTALQMWNSYQTHYANWERRRDSASSSTIMRILSNMELTLEGEVTKSATKVKEAIETFSETRLWRRLQKKQPSPPLQSQKHNPKKLPMRFQNNSNLIPFQSNGEKQPFRFEGERLVIKLNSLKKRQPIVLELKYSDYHLRELERGRLTGGKIVKNLAQHRWEFHASIRKTIPKRDSPQKQKQAILGVDLGIVTDATVVVLLEEEGLKQERFFFLKEPELRRRKFTIEQRKKVLQRIKDTITGKKRKKVIEELQNISNSYEQVSNEACHKVAKKVAAIARKYLEEDYELYVVIGQLRGLRNSVRKGDGKGKKFRGKISKFPYWKLTSYIKYKCREVGVPEENIAEVKESWTSKTCHKCGSTNTKRPTQASFECLACGCQYNADANGAINIALRYWVKNACSSCRSLKTAYLKGGLIVCSECQQEHSIKENTKANSEVVRMIFLSSRSRKSEGLSKSARPLLKVMENNPLYDVPQGTGDPPPCDESTGDEGLVITNLDQLKVEEAGKRKHFLKI